jgi:FAD synthetase
MRTVMVFGTFDLLHAGHTYFFTQAKKHGNRLIVVVARDATVVAMKGRASVQTEQERRAAVAGCPVVDEAIIGNSIDKLQVVREYTPDVICLGYDQSSTITQALERANFGIQIIRLEPYQADRYKSSIIRQKRG